MAGGDSKSNSRFGKPNEPSRCQIIADWIEKNEEAPVPPPSTSKNAARGNGKIIAKDPPMRLKARMSNNSSTIFADGLTKLVNQYSELRRLKDFRPVPCVVIHLGKKDKVVVYDLLMQQEMRPSLTMSFATHLAAQELALKAQGQDATKPKVAMVAMKKKID